MKYCRKCLEVVNDTVSSCPRCGVSVFGKWIGSATFAYDDATGSLLVDRKLYSAADIIEYQIIIGKQKEKALFITLRDQTLLALGGTKPSLFAGYGEVGKLIDIFEEKYPTLLYAANIPLREQIKAGKLPRSSSPNGLFLQTEEYAIRTDTSVKYAEQRSETTYYQSSSTAQGWTTGSMTPETRISLTNIDSGSLVITNQRVIYSGAFHSFTFSIHDILSLDRYQDGISLNTNEDPQKRMFRNIDGNLYADIIQVLVSAKGRQPKKQ